MNPPLVTRSGPTWSFTFDASAAPHHVCWVLRGQPTVERMEQIVAVQALYREQLLLPNGKLCPIVIDRREDGLPDPMMLQAWRAVLEAHQATFSGFISLVDPERTDQHLLGISMEIATQFLNLPFVTVTSWEEAMAEVERCLLRE